MLEFDTQKKSSRLILIVTIVAVLLALSVAVGTAIYFSQKYDDLKKTSEKTNDRSEKDALIKKIQKLYDTPDEDPSIVRVDDKNKINSQEFFKKAENNDIVFVYQKAKLAILYRESINKIVNTGPIALGDEEQSGGVSDGSLDAASGQQ